MAAIKLHMFGGAVPILSRRGLPDNMAELAINTDLISGEVRPFQQARLVHTFTGSGINRAARIPDPAAPNTPVWVGLQSIHGRVFRSPLVNDAFSRFIKLDGNSPGSATRALVNSLARIKLNDPWIKLGMPAPTAAPTINTHSGGSGSTTTRSYVYTFTNIFGEESQPSPPATAVGKVDDTWAITTLTAPVDAADYGITHFRIYRTVTGSTGTSYYRVREQAITATSYNDTNSDLTLTLAGLTLQSQTWRAPENFEGIVPMPNGFFAAWRGRDVFFSEPYRPWAWPAEYILSVRDRIVGCGVADSILVVLTESAPTAIGGTRPDSMAVQRMDFIAPCVAPESVFSAPEGVYFATNNALMLMTSSGPASITGSLIPEQDWRKRYAPTYISTAVTDRQIFAVQEDGFGFVLDKLEQRSGVVQLRNTLPFSVVWKDDYTGMLLGMSDSAVYEFCGCATLPSAGGWRSKEFFFPRPVNFAALRVSIDSLFDSDSASDPGASSAPVPGGPWTGQTSVYNYTQFNSQPLNTCPAPGTLPPSASPGAATWPFWYGVVPPSTAIEDLSGAGLPLDWDCYVRVLADRVAVWAGPVSNDITYRLPSGFKSAMWQFEVITRVPVFSIQVAETAKELADV